MKWKLTIGIVLSAIFLWLAFRKAQLDEVIAALASARHLLMIPAVILTLASFLVRSWRWRLLLPAFDRAPLGVLFASTMIGFMGNNLLPARLGELLRAHSVGRGTGVSRSAALASIVVERILDIFLLLLLFGVILVLRGLPAELRSWGVVLLVLALPILGLLVFYQARSEVLLRWIGPRVPERLRDRFLSIAGNFHQGLGVLNRGRTLLAAAAASVLMWACLAGVVHLCFEALQLRLPIDAGIVVLVLMAIGTMIPSAPGYIGTLQYAGTLALLQYGVDRSEALSFTLLYHASQWFPITAVGLFYFLREQFSLRQLTRLAGSGGAPDLPIPKTGTSGGAEAGSRGRSNRET